MSSVSNSSSTKPRVAPDDVARDVDLCLDTVDSRDNSRLLHTLKRGSTLYPVYFGKFDPEDTARLGVTVSGTQVRASGPQLAEFGPLLDEGTVRLAIDSTFPLVDAGRAHARAARGHIQGKIVLTVA
ncbi:zinc-binding dehydrogenase [Amycolatopsis ultiminotia]|uniref:zinc-binding dehydrogenase n=1 Tax=Amycolatopsis ultiminotia TaxID=543629 RepID=UPI0031F1AC0D